MNPAIVGLGAVLAVVVQGLVLAASRLRAPGLDGARAVGRRLTPTEPLRIVLAVVAGLMSYAIGLRLIDPTAIVYGGNDLAAHAAWAAELELVPFHPTQPHFGLHLLARSIQVLGVSGGERAVVLSVGLLTAAGAYLLYGLLGDLASPRPRSVWLAVATSVVMVGESPYVFVQRPSEIGRGAGYLTLHLWATPTNAVLLPMAVLLLPRLLAATEAPLSRRRGAVLGTLVAVAMVAKPAVPLVLVPAALVLVARHLPDWARVRARGLAILVWGVLPMALVAIWQLRFLAGLAADRDGGVRLAPLEGMRTGGMLRPVAWLALLLPLALLLAAGGRWWRDRTVVFGAAALVVGVLQFGLLGETGYREDHANWGISAYVGYLVLTVAALGAVLQRIAGSDVDAARRARWVLGGAALLCGVAGLVAFVDSTAFVGSL